MAEKAKTILQFPNLENHAVALAQLLAKYSYLPEPRTVEVLGTSVFPTVRARNGHPRYSLTHDGSAMYDDNTTPRWTVLWAHGMGKTGHPKGWTFAHVWSVADDVLAYTHLANLAMVPECLGGLTDKNGPAAGFLRWHAWDRYHWRPEGTDEPIKPFGYDQIAWRYFSGIDRPEKFIKQNFEKLNNERTRIIRTLLQNRLHA